MGFFTSDRRGVYLYESVYMEARVIARLSVSESKREFPYNIF